jgi:hypothetical protein
MNYLTKALMSCLLATIFGLMGTVQAADQPVPAGVPVPQDAYSRAEQQRREAIAYQRQLVEQARLNYYNYLYTYNPRKAYRQAWRYGYAPLYPPITRGPSDFLLGSPYYGAAKLPVGHEKIWTSPNGYIYRPLYQQPPPPTASQTRRQPTEVSAAKVPEPPMPEPQPEAIPAPPSEPGPREF